MGAGWTYGGDEEEEGNVALSTGHGRQRKWLDGRIDEWMVWWLMSVVVVARLESVRVLAITLITELYLRSTS